MYKTILVFALSALAGHVFAELPDDVLRGGHSSDISPLGLAGIIIRFSDDRSALSGEGEAYDKLQRTAEEVNVELSAARRLAIGADLFQTTSSDDKVIELVARLNELAGVEWAEPDYWNQADFTPNDTNFGDQWHYTESTAGIDADIAWDTTSGSGIVVAVIDTGVTDHDDLDSNLLAGYDFISSAVVARDGNGRDSDPADEGDWRSSTDCVGKSANDSSWHGTHVSGTVAAETNNNMGVAGVAYSADVLPLRVLGLCGGTTSDIADAIIWAAGGAVSGVPTNSNPATVINLSLGGSGSCSSTYQSAINSARANGAVVVTSAGNAEPEEDPVDASTRQPASCNGVVVVGAVNRSGVAAHYSNYGTILDVSAPGGELSPTSNGILSTSNTGATTPASDAYYFYQGTSMAAPHVSGTVALVQTVASSLNADAIENLLRDTVDGFGGSCSYCGTGIINAATAVDAAPNVPATPSTAPVAAEMCNSKYFISSALPSGATSKKLQLSHSSSFQNYWQVSGPIVTVTQATWVRSVGCNSYGCGNNSPTTGPLYTYPGCP